MGSGKSKAGPRRTQKNSQSRVRLLDVARHARCSTATVSRALNSPELVKPEIRERIRRAMSELGYTPNSAARALRSQRTRTMGIVIPTLSHAMYARMVEAAQRRLALRGYSLLVATFEYDLSRELEHTRLLIERGMEGLILVGEHHADELYTLLGRTRVPYVNTYIYGEAAPHPCVGFDNRRATSEITEFLLSQGHRHFGMISAPTRGNDRASERVAGVKETLERRGLQLPGNAVYERHYSIASGREGLRYFRSLKPAPTAIVCGNDIMAMGALIECAALGIKVPSELSIVGFDNLEFAGHLDPPLTTMEVPADEMGERAADFLVDRLLGQPTPASVHIEPKLIVRRTTAQAP